MKNVINFSIQKAKRLKKFYNQPKSQIFLVYKLHTLYNIYEKKTVF